MSVPEPKRHPANESLLEYAQRVKQADRVAQSKLEPDGAQADAEIVLDPAKWHVAEPHEVYWPGDLADPWVDPLWLDSE